MKRLLTQARMLLRTPVQSGRVRKRSAAAHKAAKARFGVVARMILRASTFGALAAMVLGSLVLLAPVIRDGVDRPVQHVRILNDLFYQDPEQVRLVIAGSRLDRFSQVPIESMRSGIQSLEWVQQAHVRRVWPDTLEVRIREQLPMARWGEKQLLNERGERFQVSSHAEFAKLPLLRGPEGSTQQVLAMHQRIAPLLGIPGLRVAEMHLSARGAWDVQFENGVLLRLGRDEVMERVGRFLAFYERQLVGKINTVAVVDTRYSSGISVTWAPGQVIRDAETGRKNS